jgi:hypothetical protein
MQYKVGQKIMTHNTHNEFSVLELIERLPNDPSDGYFGEAWRTNYGIRYSNDFEHSRRAAELQIAKLTEMLCKVDESK